MAAYIASLLLLSSPALRKRAGATSSLVITASLASLLCLSCESCCNLAYASSSFRLCFLNRCLLSQFLCALLYNLDEPGQIVLKGGRGIWIEWILLLRIRNCKPRHLTLIHVKDRRTRRVPQDQKQQKVDIHAYVCTSAYTHTSSYLHTSTGLLYPIIIRRHTHTHKYTHIHTTV